MLVQKIRDPTKNIFQKKNSFQGFVLRTAFLTKNVFFVISDPDQSTGLAEIFGFEGSIF